MGTIDGIRDHCGRFSAYYALFWGNHIHHGYRNDEGESASRAPETLAYELARIAGVQTGDRARRRLRPGGLFRIPHGLSTIDDAFRTGKMAYVLFGSR